MKIQQNEVRRMLASQIKADLSLHCTEQFDFRALFENLFDQGQTRKVIFDVEKRAFLSFYSTGILAVSRFERSGLFQRRFCPRQFNPEGTSVTTTVFYSDCATHSLN